MTLPPEKSEGAFRTIREVADWLAVPTHVLRFWESKFDMIAPVKGAGGRRYYRPEDMRLLGGIKVLLHDQGLTIRGVSQRIEADGTEPVMALSPDLEMSDLPAARTRRVIRSDEDEGTARVVPFYSRETPAPADGPGDASAAGGQAGAAAGVARTTASSPPEAPARPAIRKEGAERPDSVAQPDAPDAPPPGGDPSPDQPVDTPGPPQPDDSPIREPRSPPQPIDVESTGPARAPAVPTRTVDPAPDDGTDGDEDPQEDETEDDGPDGEDDVAQLGDTPEDDADDAADAPRPPASKPGLAPGERRRLRRALQRLRTMIDDVERELSDGFGR